LPFWDVIVVGAGPCGLSCAATFQAAGLETLVVEKGCLADSIYRFPDGMRFFSGPAGLEIGSLPMQCAGKHPTRSEALIYYRQVTRQFRLQIQPFTPVARIGGTDGDFRVQEHRARKVVVATGYFGWPNRLQIPGEELPKVTHYFRDEHPYADARVLVIGGGNSAGNTALALAGAGADVTLAHRGDRFSMKPWLREAVEDAIAGGSIRGWKNSRALQIEPHSVALETPQGLIKIDNDFVFAMTGYHPDFKFLRANGIPGRAGIYLAGAVCGQDVNIENGRSHADQILSDLMVTSSK
jgi:thioredoxin reductase (NADPH)